MVLVLKLRERHKLEDLKVCGTIILKMILRNWVGKHRSEVTSFKLRIGDKLL
jgi:hypothetical protein